MKKSIRSVYFLLHGGEPVPVFRAPETMGRDTVKPLKIFTLYLVAVEKGGDNLIKN